MYNNNDTADSRLLVPVKLMLSLNWKLGESNEFPLIRNLINAENSSQVQVGLMKIMHL